MSCSRRTAALAPLLLAVAFAAAAAPEVRIKDIAYLRGLRANQVLGIGLVTGLAGKGDSQASGLLKTTLASLVSTFGVDVSAADIRSKNCAVVMVSAELPALAKVGDRIDATVSSIGDARDLDGGVLLQAALLAANGKTYAVAQGRVVSTPDPAGVRTVGSVPGGAMVEQDVVATFVTDEVVTVVLRLPRHPGVDTGSFDGGGEDSPRPGRGPGSLHRKNRSADGRPRHDGPGRHQFLERHHRDG
jgi:flagellar P-ring protein precursor FlgI